ncbi:Uncharacterised protein [Delftia tsuruhatensis]|uniref:hypothetical protein n=1 Tax=Delftia tsuruhatensis TaxID=180282 RepID=UPI001E7A7EA4|nr:hypothetical protein [Delftia tsuruhatensis]CAB5670472.1 Uncharacterised protein [Delftia tsuruhatensis]CAC9683018.1 Uncharacterised protein [Delftia tsuruhatensis]
MSTTAGDTPHCALDATTWREFCTTAAAYAQRGCGLSYDHYVTLFSTQIDEQVRRLPASQRAQALAIATQQWGYETPAERQATQDSLADDGCCSHGIAFGYCPAGCDLPDDDDWD